MSLRRSLGAVRRAFPAPLRDPLWLARARLREALAPAARGVRGSLLDVGCGLQPYRDLFCGVSRYVALERSCLPGVDLVADALRLPFADASFDAVLCNQVLEHVSEPAALVGELARVLRPGGVLLLTTPQTWGLHHVPHDYFRFTRFGLAHLAERAGLEVEVVRSTCGVWATLGQRLADVLVHELARSEPVRGGVTLALAPLLLAAAALDRITGPRGDTLDNLLLARRPP